MLWMVLPPALIAATPVGATTTVFLSVCDSRFLRKVVLPVPAFPVKNICCWVSLTKENAKADSELVSIERGCDGLIFPLSVVNIRSVILTPWAGDPKEGNGLQGFWPMVRGCRGYPIFERGHRGLGSSVLRSKRRYRMRCYR